MKLKFEGNTSGYKRCSYCDTQLKDSQFPYFYEHHYLDKLICNKEDWMRTYLTEYHSRLNLILPHRGNPFKD